MTSKRSLENRLDDLEGDSFGNYPRATLCEILSADEVRVGGSIDGGSILLVDGEGMAVSEDAFKEFWVADLEEANDQEDA